MKDIDFDELDKAVNSLMGSVKDTPTKQPSEPAHPMPEASSADKILATTAAAEPQSIEPSPENRQAASPTAPVRETSQAVRKSSGRFMDVVHPSSDMRSSSPMKTPARSSGITPPARASAPVSPVKPLQMSPEPEESQPKDTAATTGTSSEVVFPDPLDLTPQIEADKEAPTKGDNKEEAASAASDVELTEELSQTPKTTVDDSSEPLESLFLPNVKVEKRPLNISGNTDMTADEDSTSSDKPAEKNDDDKKDAPSLVTPDPTLAELGEDVLAIESDTSSSAPEKSQSEEETASPIDQSVTATPFTSANPAVSSIPRQYNVKPSSDAKHHEALYDTAAQAGAPLAHPAKKKSGWMVVLWIVLLIVVGVGGALALYFLKVF